MIRSFYVILISIMLTIMPSQGLPQAYFSKFELDSDSLKSLYKDVPLHGGTDIESFVVEIKDIENIDQIKATSITDHVACQPFIDGKGEVETIFIIKSVSNYIDSLAIEALKRSKFKPLQMSGKLTKYSCIVKYYFNEGLMLYSSVNDIVMNAPEKPYYALTKKPEVIKQSRPEYPISARKAGVEGRVTVRVLINTDGKVEKVEVIKGHPMLNEAAMDAASKWEFTPGEQDGKPVKVWMNIPIDYKLKR